MNRQTLSINVRIAEANDQLAKIFGLDSPHNFINHRLSDFFDFKKKAQFDMYKKGILGNYRLSDCEISAKNNQGEELYLQFSIMCMLNGDRLIGGWGLIKDISERTIAANNLKASEERYRFLANTVPVIFWTAQPGGTIDFYNKKWNDYTGVTIGSSFAWKDYIHPEDIKRSEETWNSCLHAGDKYEVEYRIKRYDGTYRWHLDRAFPLKDNEGKILKWMGTATDIDEQKNFEHLLQKKNEELDNFIYMASHDLKAPVSNIEGLVQALNSSIIEQCKDSEELQMITDLMNESIDKFKNNLLDLIEITKAQQGSEETEVENQLEEVTEDVLVGLRNIIEASNAKINFDFQSCPTIKFSKTNLRSILHNLISNAVKYHSPDRDPIVNISCEESNDYIILSIEDNGLGFAENEIDQVFTKFKRMHKEIEGSGVGLYIIKRIISNAKGKIELQSTQGEGSTFNVFFKK